MDRNAVIALVLLFVAISTVSSFGGNNQSPQFGGGDYNDRKFQSWLFKRGLGLGNPAFGSGFGTPLGDADGRFFNWREFLNGDGISKRQLNYGSGRFGSFRRYFTNGLQDWRNSYNGMKRKREVTYEDQ